MKRDEQTKTQSLVEQITSQIIVFVFAVFTAHLFVYEMFGVTVSMNQNIGMMIYWTFQSIFLRYFMRRFFEKRLVYNVYE